MLESVILMIIIMVVSDMRLLGLLSVICFLFVCPISSEILSLHDKLKK